jgi:large subunit ribosomal protein L29
MKLKAAELRQMTAQELSAQLDEFKEEYFNLRFQQTSGQLEDVNRLRVTRRNIARIKTIMREKELEALDAE